MPPTFHPCIFFAVDGNIDTYQARDYLAITYYPRFCSQYDLPDNFGKEVLKDNMGNSIANLRSYPDKVPGSWASFGQPGGAKEVILVDDSKSVESCPSNHSPLIGGGETDEFHQNDTANYDMEIAEEIANIVVPIFVNNEDIASENLEDWEQRGVPIGTIKRGSGITITAKIGDKFVSISTSFLLYGSSIRIKVWAALWKDDDYQAVRIRQIYGPLKRYLDFTLRFQYANSNNNHENVKEELKERLRQQDYPFYELRDIITELVKRVTQVTGEFFKLNAKEYSIS